MRDRLIQERIAVEREAFINSLDQKVICDLASSYHDGTRCGIFNMKLGYFNVCFLIEFITSTDWGLPDKWVVRIPFPGRIPWVDEKIDSEVATIK